MYSPSSLWIFLVCAVCSRNEEGHEEVGSRTFLVVELKYKKLRIVTKKSVDKGITLCRPCLFSEIQSKSGRA